MRINQETWDELELPWSRVERIHTHDGRWANYYDIIFELDGKFYSVNYGFGATEDQEDQSPFDYADEIEVTEVHKVEVKTLRWVPVEA